MIQNPKWLDNSIQFPRLLAEIAAVVGFTDEQKDELCTSMDLNWSEIDELLERAVVEFDEIKAELP